MNEIVQGWFENQQVGISYNQHDRTCDNYQPGKVGLITKGETSLRHIRNTNDSFKESRKMNVKSI